MSLEDLEDKMHEWLEFGLYEKIGKKTYRMAEWSICYISYEEI